MFKKIFSAAVVLGTALAVAPAGAFAQYYQSYPDNRYYDGNRYSYNDREYREQERREWRERERRERERRKWELRREERYYRGGSYDRFGYWHP